jgi:Rrf2 family protein
MISQKAKYGIKALAFLGERGLGESVQIEEIARQAKVPRKFLEHILLDLKRRAIVDSRRGRSGGYALVKSPKDLTIGEILRAIDGPIAPLPCVSRTAYRRCADCADEKTCVVRRLFADAWAAQLLLLEGTTLDSAIRRPLAEIGASPRETISASTA